MTEETAIEQKHEEEDTTDIIEQKQINPVTNLSKSWKIKEINSTLHTGGKIVISNGKNSVKVPSSSTSLEEEKDELEEENEDEASLFLVASCNNNVSCVNNRL